MDPTGCGTWLRAILVFIMLCFLYLLIMLNRAAKCYFSCPPDYFWMNSILPSSVEQLVITRSICQLVNLSTPVVLFSTFYQVHSESIELYLIDKCRSNCFHPARNCTRGIVSVGLLKFCWWFFLPLPQQVLVFLYRNLLEIIFFSAHFQLRVMEVECNSNSGFNAFETLCWHTANACRSYQKGNHPSWLYMFTLVS